MLLRVIGISFNSAIGIGIFVEQSLAVLSYHMEY